MLPYIQTVCMRHDPPPRSQAHQELYELIEQELATMMNFKSPFRQDEGVSVGPEVAAPRTHTGCREPPMMQPDDLCCIQHLCTIAARDIIVLPVIQLAWCAGAVALDGGEGLRADHATK
jgi:hypothetical protein